MNSRQAIVAASLLTASVLAGAAAAGPLPGPLPDGVNNAAQLVAQIQSGRADVPRVELAARLKAAGFAAERLPRNLEHNAARMTFRARVASS